MEADGGAIFIRDSIRGIRQCLEEFSYKVQQAYINNENYTVTEQLE